MSRISLNDILSLADHDGLLDVSPQASNVSSDESRIISDFEELNRFVETHKHAPGESPSGGALSVKERVLALRLKGYRESPRIALTLKEYDRFSLLRELENELTPPANLDDILGLDDDLLSPPGEEIFELKHARPRAAKPDRVSERKPCLEFDRFKPLFDQCVADLVSGKRRSLKFANEQEIRAGEFFILNGVMVFVAEINDPHVRNGKRNARLRLIFENGTEGENLLRSLATELYKDSSGRRISSPDSGPLFTDDHEDRTLSENDHVSGTIYIVRSLSNHPEILEFGDNVYKIGVTTGSVEDRIRGAKEDPTFLFAPVHLIRSFQAVNLMSGRLEILLHRFFRDAQLNIELKDRFGKPFRPQEWFVLPLSLVERAIRMMLDGTILQHRYDAALGEIVPRDGSHRAP